MEWKEGKVEGGRDILGLRGGGLWLEVVVWCERKRGRGVCEGLGSGVWNMVSEVVWWVGGGGSEEEEVVLVLLMIVIAVVAVSRQQLGDGHWAKQWEQQWWSGAEHSAAASPLEPS